jgi:uncharacterized protein involved in type VI secretion and phage assembly
MSMTHVAPTETTVEAGGHAKGVAVAVVRENKDDSGMARVKVSYPWHDRPQQSYWARVVAPMAGKQRGIYFLPEVGDEVLVAFDRGDLRFPYVIGALWNGVDKAALDNGDGKNDVRQIRTRKGHKLTFDDGSQGLVQLELNDGRRLTFKDDLVELVDGKGNTLAFKSNAGEVTLEAATKLTLKAPKILVEASGTAEVKAGATLTLRGTTVNIN